MCVSVMGEERYQVLRNYNAGFDTERGREIKRVREGVRERERVMIEGEKYIKREKGCCVSINARRP